MKKAASQCFLFVGLGNPGPRYAMTRHNLGYRVVENYAHELQMPLKHDERFNALVAKMDNNDKTVHCLLPLTYMNLSGIAVRSYIDYFKVPLSNLVVVVDDIALAFGQMRLREQGGTGGHRGLEDIHLRLSSAAYIRLRMGIGHPSTAQELAAYVLDVFSNSEQDELPNYIDRGVEVLKSLLKENIQHIIHRVNRFTNQMKKTDSASGRQSVDLTKPPSLG